MLAKNEIILGRKAFEDAISVTLKMWEVKKQLMRMWLLCWGKIFERWTMSIMGVRCRRFELASHLQEVRCHSNNAQ